MKRILMITGLFLPLFLFGCQTQNKKTDDKLTSDLWSFYHKVQSIGGQTRAGEDDSLPFTEAELEEIFAVIAEISEDNGIREIIAQSGYYQGEMLDFATADGYDILQWIEKNGTPELYDIMLQLSEGADIPVENIISNKKLLPNEKAGLIFEKGTATLFEIDNNGGTLFAPTCKQILDKKLGLCLYWRDNALVAAAASVFIFGPFIAGGVVIGIWEMWKDCKSEAHSDYNVCITNK